MWCPSPHYRERWIYQLIWGETAKLFPEYHRHTIVHLHWIQIQVNSNSRLNDLQLPLTVSCPNSFPSLGLSLPLPATPSLFAYHEVKEAVLGKCESLDP